MAPAPGIVVAEAPGAEPDAVEAIEMAAYEDAEPGAGAAARLLVNLQPDALEGNGVVLPHGADLFMTEDVGEVHAPERDKGRGRIRGRPGEAAVVGREELFAQIPIGGGDGADAGDAELIDDAPLEGAVEAFAAAAGLQGVGRDVLDAEAGQRAADLRELVAVHGLPGFRGVEGPCRRDRCREPAAARGSPGWSRGPSSP